MPLPRGRGREEKKGIDDQCDSMQLTWAERIAPPGKPVLHARRHTHTISLEKCVCARVCDGEI